jgi:hypothetical protein
MGDQVVLSASNGTLNATNSAGTVTLLTQGGYNGGILAGFGTTTSASNTSYFNSNAFSTPFPVGVTPVVMLSPLNLYSGSTFLDLTSLSASNVTVEGFQVYSNLQNLQYSWMAMARNDFPPEPPAPPEFTGDFVIENPDKTEVTLTITFDSSEITGTRPLTYTLNCIPVSSGSFIVNDLPVLSPNAQTGPIYTYVVRDVEGLSGWPDSSLAANSAYSFSVTVENDYGDATSYEPSPFQTNSYEPASSGATLDIIWSGATGQTIDITVSNINFVGNISTLTYYVVVTIQHLGSPVVFDEPLTLDGSVYTYSKNLSTYVDDAGLITVYALDSGAPSAGDVNKTSIPLNFGDNPSFTVPQPPLNIDLVSASYEEGVPPQTVAVITLSGVATGGTSPYT